MTDTYCGLMVAELQASGITLEKIAAEVGVTVRQVSKWKQGAQPCGVAAIRLYKFHEKHGTVGHGTTGQLADQAGKADISR